MIPFDRFRDITDSKTWSREAQRLLNKTSFDQNFAIAFHNYWSVAGHHIRSQINDDQTLANLLTAILPKYIGPDVRLYRGENKAKWEAGDIGFCWTSFAETAKMFGRGLNAIKSGGLLLEVICPTAAVIAGPSDHSVYLSENEYTLNPHLLSSIKILETYPVAA